METKKSYLPLIVKTVLGVLAALLVVIFSMLALDLDDHVFVIIIPTGFFVAGLTIITWLYVTTKIVFSIVSKKRTVLRVVAWLILGSLLAIVFYVAFIAVVMSFAAMFEAVS